MRTLLLLLLIAGSGYYLYLNHIKEESRAQAPVITTTKAPIKCSHCAGLGKLVDYSGDKKIGYRCPICNGLGQREPLRGVDCPYCQGFGKVPTKSLTEHRPLQRMDTQNRAGGERMIAQRCPICEGNGINPTARN